MAEPLLTVKGVHAGYGDVPVLWGIDAAIERGEIACLIGSNGAGKTTLMRTISGLVRATAGSIIFEGRELAAAEPDAILAAGIAHVPEGRRLFSAMSIRDNLLMGAIARGLMGAPKMLLIDELSLGLAPAIVDQLCDALRALNREGLTLLVVEQDVATALELAKHAFVMDTGRITRSGESATLANDPAIREAYLGSL